MDLLRTGAVHVRAIRSRFALQKCRPERPGAFRAKKMLVFVVSGGSRALEALHLQCLERPERFALQKCRP